MLKRTETLFQEQNNHALTSKKITQLFIHIYLLFTFFTYLYIYEGDFCFIFLYLYFDMLR